MQHGHGDGAQIDHIDNTAQKSTGEEAAVRSFIIRELGAFYRIHNQSLEEEAATIWDQQTSLEELQAALRHRYGSAMWERGGDEARANVELDGGAHLRSDRPDINHSELKELQNLTQGKMTAAATAISSLTKTLQQERQSCSALRMSIRELEGKHAALQAQHSAVCAQLTTCRREQGKVGRRDEEVTCQGCIDAEELDAQRVRQCEDQKKAVQMTKTMLARAIARHQAQADAAAKSLTEALDSRDKAEKRLAVAHEVRQLFTSSYEE